jgi:hypothetical protein
MRHRIEGHLDGLQCKHILQNVMVAYVIILYADGYSRRLGVAPGPALEGASRFRPKVVLMSLSSYILR